MFKSGTRLQPAALYGSIIGLLEKDSQNFDRVEIIGDGYSIEQGRVYVNKNTHQHIVIHYPGQKLSPNPSQERPEPQFSTVKEEVEEHIKKKKIQLNHPLYLFPILEYEPRQHFFMAWIEDNELSIEDSMSEPSSDTYDVTYVNKLNPQSTPARKPIFKEWQGQFDYWQCGYYSYAVAKRKIYGEQEAVKPEFKKSLFTEMKQHFKKYIPNNYVQNDNEENVVMTFDDDLEIDIKKDKKDDIIAEIDARIGKYGRNINPFVRYRDARAVQLMKLKEEIQSADNFSTALNNWKVSKVEQKNNPYNTPLSQADLMKKHNNIFFTADRSKDKKTAIQEFIEDLEDKYKNTTFDKK